MLHIKSINRKGNVIYMLKDTDNEKLENSSGIKDIIKLIILGFLGYLCGMFLVTFVIGIGNVPTNSMSPTIIGNDKLLISPIPFYFRNPERFEVVTFQSGDMTLVKRVIGMPNDVIDLVDGQVFINGEALNESAYLSSNIQTYEIEGSSIRFPYVVPEESYFMLGDNRGNSSDSRLYGAVARDAIRGDVLIRIFPFNRIGKVE